MIKLMLITNSPGLAAFAAGHGVDRIFVDLEVNGKYERQGHRDTLISHHTMKDVRRVRDAIPGHELLVRLNPDCEESEEEIERAIEAGADILMLPMFRTMQSVRKFVQLIAGRCRFVPLVETGDAADLVDELVQEAGIDELYFGLNDLHLDLGRDFMFELLVDGTVERLSALCRDAKMPFGFGGVARIGEGLVPGELVLAEHKRLGSSSVILSRTFHRSAASLNEMRTNVDFELEVGRLRASEEQLELRSREQKDRDHEVLVSRVGDAVRYIRSGGHG